MRFKSFVRYVDDSHARFPHIDEALLFKDILNQQHPNIKYTIECEDENKTLNFLDIKITNDQSGKYKFNIHRKNAITNIQVKPTSSHDPKILNGIFKGFVHRAFTLCSEQYIDQELQFLVEMFTENGYEKDHLKKLINEIRQKRTQNNDKSTSDEKQTITLPWIPLLSPKLRKYYKRAGYKTVFKSNANLKTSLSSRNKSSLPKNSQPGVYKIKCTCSPRMYIGETKLQVRTRVKQHEENVFKGNWDKSALATHAKTCTNGSIDWNNIETVKVENNTFNRKVREALEIQYNKCGPKYGGYNLDDGQYVKTQFWTPFFDFLKKRNQNNVNQKKPQQRNNLDVNVI